MTTGEKLSKLRKENNYTQEQLAELLRISRQAISKWESDSAYPETEKLIKISKLYNCSLDYLLKNELAQEKPEAEKAAVTGTVRLNLADLCYERKSEKTVRGVPLWHINLGMGRTATGIFALGFAARGVFACGLFSVGVFSCGVLSLGLSAFGCFVLGLIAVGSIAVGAAAVGGVAIGFFTLGGCAIGQFAVGGAATGSIAAAGGSAVSDCVAFGINEARGRLMSIKDSYDVSQYTAAFELIKANTPFGLNWAMELFRLFV